MPVHIPTTRQIVEVLKRARMRTLGAPCRRAYARTVDGHPTSSNSPDAVAWCAQGAVHREAVDGHGLPDGTDVAWVATARLDAAAMRLVGTGAARLNDARPDLVAAMFDSAIAESEVES